MIGLNLFLGVFAIFLLLQTRKESVSALFGYSANRLVIIFAETIALVLFIGILVWVWNNKYVATRFSNWLTNPPSSSDISLSLVIFFLLSYIGLLWIAITGRWNQLGFLGDWIWRGQPLVLWPGTIALQVFFYRYFGHKSNRDKSTVLSMAITNACIVFLLLDTLLRTKGFANRSLQTLALKEILPDFAWAAILLIILILWNRIFRKFTLLDREAYVVVYHALLVFLAAMILYALSAMGVGKYGTGEQTYSHELAKALLEGHAYLENPGSIIDLTYANGHWYVPYPPLVAILMMPQVALFGTEAMNAGQFCIFFASLNTMLVFMILEKLRLLGWTKVSQTANIWLTALFSLGTVHWYLALWGEVWPLNQITATTFVALAVLVTLYGKRAWLAGLSLGMAMLARPHLGLTYPLLFGIYYHSLNPAKVSSQWKDLFKWLVSSGLGLSIAAIGVLFYNHVRFGSLLDFGYDASQINVGLFRGDLLEYGQFHIHFVLRNLQVMVFGLPHWNAQCNFFSADEIGMSIFVTTPALLYVFRARKMTPLIVGAWVTVGLFLTVLLLHYSTGAFQFGYRFLLDFLIPIMILLAAGLPREKISLSQKTLILAGILVNYWGLWWFFKHWCR